MRSTGFFKGIFGKRNKGGEAAADTGSCDRIAQMISSLDASCNNKFSASFRKCRLEFGREFVDLMDLKKKLISKKKSTSGYYPMQDMIAEKILRLIDLYFDLASSYISVKTENKPEEWVVKHLDAVGIDMSKTRSLIMSLNNQFYLSTGAAASGSLPASESESREMINEAEALCNVLNERSSRQTVKL